MSRKALTYCRISHKDKRLYIPFKKEFDAVIALMAKKDVDVYGVIEFRETHKKRTSPQNRYYFGVIVDILARLMADSCGEQVNDGHRSEAHMALKRLCNPKEITSPITGEVITVAGSTRDHDTVESSEFHERCRQWIFEFWGVTVPLPNEQSELF